MGCLKNVTRSIFLTVFVAGFIAIGGQKWVKDQINNFLHPTKDVIMERAQKVGDFSKINKEFEIEKAAGIMGYNAVLAEHKASGQKMIVVDPGNKVVLTQEDIASQDAEAKIKDAISKFKYQTAAIDDFRVTEKGTMDSYGKTVPFVRFSAKVKKLPVGEITGIISVVKDSKGNDRILVSLNHGEKYSQLISNEFFKAVK